MSITSFITAIASSASGNYWISTISDSTNSSNIGTSPVITLLSTGEVVMSAKSWTAQTKTAVIKLSLSGSVDWASLLTSTNNDTSQYGIARDSNDDIYVPTITNTTTQFRMYRINSSGTTQSADESGGWSDQAAQNLQIYLPTDTLYHAKANPTSGAHVYTDTLPTLSGTPDDVIRLIPSSTVFPGYTYADGTSYYLYGYQGAGASSRPIFYRMNSDSTAPISFGPWEWNVSNCSNIGVERGGNNRLAVYSGDFYVPFVGQKDTSSAQETVYLLKTQVWTSTSPSITWAKSLDYPTTANALRQGPVIADSTGRIHSVNRVQGPDPNPGLYITTFDTSGNFQSELIILGGSQINHYTGLIDSNDDMYISIYSNTGSSYSRPSVIKIPSDYSSISSGTYGDYTITYNTSSTLTIDTPSVSLGTFFNNNDTTLNMSWGAGTDNSSSTSNISASVTSI